jgi:hypothetical protein
MSGMPFAANPLSGLYYPLNWLFLFLPWLPLEVGFNVSALVHLWLAGATMYALMRLGFDTGGWGALVSAVAYQGSPKLLAHLGVGHVGWVQAWAWLPVVVLCVLKASQSPSGQAGKWRVGAGVLLAIQFCADVRMAAYTLTAVTTLVVARTLGRLDSSGQGAIPGLRSEIWDLRLMIPGLAIFLGLSTCQWLPALALLPDTTRSSLTLSDAAVWSLPWRYLGGLLLADHGGFHEWMTYTGVGTIVFACGGVSPLWRRQHRWTELGGTPVQRWLVGWLFGVAVFATWFSLGVNGGLFQAMWRVVPGLGLLRVPPRAWILVVFATAALAGLGMEGTARLRGEERRRAKRRKRALVLSIGTLPVMLVLGYWLMFGKAPLNLMMFGLITPLAIGLCDAQQARRRKQWLGAAAVLLVALDLWVVDSTLIGARASEDVFTAGRAAAEWLAEQPARFRIYSPSYSIPQHVAEQYDLELAYGVDPLQLRAYARYLTRAAGLQSPQDYSVTLPPLPEGIGVQAALQDVSPNPEMLGQLGVRYVVAAFRIADSRLDLVHRCEDTYIYQNRADHTLVQKGQTCSIVLADGKVLYQYRAWPVYAGWAVSGSTLAALIGWIVWSVWKARRDG